MLIKPDQKNHFHFKISFRYLIICSGGDTFALLSVGMEIVIGFCLVFAEGRGLGKENSHNICLLVSVLCNSCNSILHFQMKHVILMLL